MTATLKQTLDASLFFTTTQAAIRDAKTLAQIEVAARALDSAAFDALPAGAREDLAAYYAQRLFHITGGLTI